MGRFKPTELMCLLHRQLVDIEDCTLEESMGCTAISTNHVPTTLLHHYQ